MTDERLPRAMVRLKFALDAVYEEASRELELTAQQAELLCRARHPAPVGALAGAMGCDRSNVSRMVDRAAARGLLERRRDAHDGRVAVVALTTAGDAAMRAFVDVLERRLASLAGGVPAARHADAARLLGELAEALERPTS